ncbi:MAG: MFS transporter, partial [Chlamydiia bacterium]|nr:MFS transporter [Chlamydiia bacterium]
MHKESRIQGIFIFVITVIFLTYDQFMRAAPQVAQHHMMHERDLPQDIYGLMSITAVYVYICMQIPIGILYDRLSSRIILPFAIACSSLGLFFMAWSLYSHMTAVGNILLMIGAPFAFLSMLIMAARWFPHSNFGMLSGIGQLFSTLGILVGGVPITLLVNYYFSWRVVMIVLGTVGVILVLMSLMVVQDSVSAHGMHRSSKFRYIKELKSIFTSKQLWLIGLYAFTGWGPIVVFAKHWAFPFVKERFLVSDAQAHQGLTLFWIAAGFLSPLFGYLSARWKQRVPILVFSSIIGLMGCVGFLYFPGSSFGIGVISCLAIGIAAAGQILGFALVKDRVPKTSLGAALGFNLMLSVLGGVVCDYFVEGVLAFFSRGPTGYYSLLDYR